MLPKPNRCRGCPFYQDGQGFVPDRIQDGSKILFYAQNPGADEEIGRRYVGGDEQYESTVPQPLIGKTGNALDNYLRVVGLNRDDVSLGNALRCRWKKSNELPVLDTAKTREALEHCHKAHFKMPESTRLIIASGEYSLYALTQHGIPPGDKISDWRGYLLPFQPVGTSTTTYNDIWHPRQSKQPPVLATYHIAYIFRDPSADLITKMDFKKINRILKGEWPSDLPLVLDGPPAVWPTQVAFDTEYIPSNKHFLMYSMFDGHKLRVSEKLRPGVVQNDSSYNVIMHNSPADLEFLEQMLPSFSTDDTMHAHAVLWSDFDHDLGFLGSLYGRINRWKHLSHLNEKIYSGADAYVTWDSWYAMADEFKRDTASYNIYRNIQMKLIPIIRRATERGIRVNQPVVEKHMEKRSILLKELEQKAHAVAGWPININSNDHTGNQLFLVEQLLKLLR